MTIDKLAVRSSNKLLFKSILSLAVKTAIASSLLSNVVYADDVIDSSDDLEVITITHQRHHGLENIKALAQGRTTEPDLANWLSSIPGANINSNGPVTGIAQYRGMYGDRVAASIDGHAVIGAGPNAMDTPLSYSTPLIVDAMTVYRGIAPVSAGMNTLGGAINVAMRKAEVNNSQSLDVSGDVQSAYRSNNQAGTLSSVVNLAKNDHALMLYGNWQAGDDMESGDGLTISPSEFEKRQFGGDLRYSKDETELGFGYHYTDTQDSGTAALPMDIEYIFSHRASLDGKMALSDWKFDWQLSYLDADHGMTNFDLRFNDNEAKHRRNNAAATTIDYKFELSREFTFADLTIGLDGYTAEHDSLISNPNNNAFFVANFNQVSDERIGLYIELKKQVNDLEIQFGARIKQAKLDAGDVGTSMAMMHNMDMTADAGMDMTADTGMDMTADAGMDMTADAGMDMTADTGMDMTADTGMDMTADAGMDMTADAGMDMTADAGMDMTGDAGMDMTADAGMDMTGDAGMDMTDDAGMDMTADADMDMSDEMNMDDMPSMADLAIDLRDSFNEQSKKVEETNLDLSLSITQQMSDTVSLYLGLGLKNRAPSYQELYLWTPMEATGGLADGNTYIGNLGLKSEQAKQIDLGFTYQGKDSEISPHIFYQQVDDYIQGTPLGMDAMSAKMMAKMMAGNETPLQFNNVDAELYGIDINAQTTVGDNLHLSAVISYVEGKRRDIEDNLYRIAPLNATFNLSYIYNDWLANINFKTAAKQDKVSVTNNEQVSSGYGVFGLDLQYYANSNLTLRLGIDNVFDRNYQDHLGGYNRAKNTDIAVMSRLPSEGRSGWVDLSYSF